jgi:hypothetical protein
MIGIKSLVIAVLCALSIGVLVATGMLGAAELGRLSVASCLVLGVLTSLCVGLIGAGGGLGRAGGAGLDLRRWALVAEGELPGRSPKLRDAGDPGAPKVRQLPGWTLRLLLGATFLAIAAATLGNHGVVRLRELGAGGPPAGRCADPSAAAAAPEELDEPEPLPPPPPVDQAGCALVRRAYQLGYSSSLGSCAPKQAAAPVPVARKIAPPPEPCTRRQIDEPFLHYAWRRWAEAARWFSDVRPVAGSVKQAEEVRTKLGYFGALTASSGHALGAVPHAAHHLWIALPDPRPSNWLMKHLAGRDCEARYVEVPLWRRWKPGEEAALVEHALGQLLFSSRFGTTTACANYRFHWGAEAGACDRLLADAPAFLREQGEWDDVAGVLDRRSRQLELRTLARTLGRHEPPEPPPATAVVSLSCVRVDPSLAVAEVTGKVAKVEGQPLGVRQLRLPKIAVEGDGPIELVAQLAKLLAGGAGTSGFDDELAALTAEVEGAAAADGGATAPEEGNAGAAPVQPGLRPAPNPSSIANPSTTPTTAAATPAPPAVPAPPRAPPLTAAQRVQLLDGAGFSLARLEALEGTDPFTAPFAAPFAAASAGTGAASSGSRWPLQRPELVEIYPLQRSLFAFIDGFRRRYFAQRGRL